jgi:hypothetical protein
MNGIKDYTTQVSPRKVMESVNRGFERLRNFRNMRILYLRNYVGPGYDRESGVIGQEPLALIFNAIRVLIPNIVMNFATHKIETPYLQDKQYCENLALAIKQHDKQIDIPNIYRCVTVDALFAMGIMKTGLCASDSVYAFTDNDHIDAGTVYTARVDFDNYVADPSSKEHLFLDARFEGERIVVPRQKLLDSGNYKNDLIERLPRCGDDNKDKRASDLSMRGIQANDNYDLDDEVEIVEVYVPSANAILTVPAGADTTFDDYLGVADFYGVKEGPYTKLMLTPPVPGNPLAVPLVGVWNDLHVKANEMATKIIDQAGRQKDVTAYKRGAADDAEELRIARDGSSVAVDDVDAVKVLSFGGQKNSNDAHLANLQGWFNMMAGNPQQMGGQAQAADSATGSMILQQNASISLEDMKDLVYRAGAQEARKRAFYFDTDPMMSIPLTKRVPQPAQFAAGPMGPVMISPPTMQDVQILLTPEQRSGQHMDWHFTIEPESMGRKDSRTRFMQAMDFCTKILPAVFTAAQAATMLGIPFSAKMMMLRLAKEAGIDWIEEVFYDPEFQMQMMMQMSMLPQQSKGQAVPAGGGAGGMPGGAGGMAALMQNGQPSNVGAGAVTPFGQMHQQFQQSAVPAQQAVKAGY